MTVLACFWIDLDYDDRLHSDKFRKSRELFWSTPSQEFRTPSKTFKLGIIKYPPTRKTQRKRFSKSKLTKTLDINISHSSELITVDTRHKNVSHVRWDETKHQPVKLFCVAKSLFIVSVQIWPLANFVLTMIRGKIDFAESQNTARNTNILFFESFPGTDQSRKILKHKYFIHQNVLQ